MPRTQRSGAWRPPVVVAVALAVTAGVLLLGVAAMVAPTVLAPGRTTPRDVFAAIHSAQATFAASCGNGLYATSLEQLGVAPDPAAGHGSVPFISPHRARQPLTEHGYDFVFVPGPAVPGARASCNGAPPGTLVASYFVGASPAGDRDGRGLHYATNQHGTIYESPTAMEVTFEGRPPGALLSRR